jgi:N-acyl-D-amino-acid deacylase
MGRGSWRLAVCPPADREQPMFDLVIAGGTIVDGTGRAGYRGDVGVSGQVIEAIGSLSRAEVGRVIDASGLIVSPGFVDTHTHSEGSLLVDPQHANGIRQGVTTELLGIDGMSYAPLSADNYRTYRHWLGGLLGDPPEDLDMSSVAAFRGHYHGKVAVNTAYLVPHATVRLEALGFRDLPLRGDALDRARRLVREGLEQGAVGFTTGGRYYPGPWADTEELIELCRVVEEAGKVHMCEPRQPQVAARAFGGSGVAEAMEISRQTGVRLHFAHFRTAEETAGRIDAIMAPVDAGRTPNTDVTFDIYPYPTGSSIAVALLPDEAQEGGPAAILRRLGDATARRALADNLDTLEEPKLSAIVFSYLPASPELEGTTLRDLAARRGRTKGEVLCELLLEQSLKVGYVAEPPDDAGVWRQLDRDFMELLGRPDYMVCTDNTPAGRFPHPRGYGAFPRFLGRLRREIGTLSLEAMVHRMTERPARRFGLARRGRIERGYYADLVVFDDAIVSDTATYQDPRRYPVGIPYVVVNGAVAVDDGRCTGVLAGQAVP